MFKKIIILLLLFTLSCSLTACSSQEKGIQYGVEYRSSKGDKVPFDTSDISLSEGIQLPPYDSDNIKAKITLKNLSDFTIDSFQVFYTISNGSSVFPAVFSGPISPGESMEAFARVKINNMQNEYTNDDLSIDYFTLQYDIDEKTSILIVFEKDDVYWGYSKI